MMNGISLRHWRSFEAAAAFGSFSRAADALEITQPAVSMQLRQLEDAVGAALFDKQARPMQLTPAGQILLRHARAILAEVRVAEDAVATLAAGLKGVLHLGLVEPANYFAPLLVRAFRARHPELSLDIRIAKRDALIEQLGEFRLDLAVAGYPPAEADVEATTFAHHPHVVIAASDHPLAARPGLQWDDLAHEPVVLRERGSSTRQFMEHLWHARGLRPPVAAELQGNETIKQAVMVGLGVSLMSGHAIQVELEARRLAVLALPDMPKRLDWCMLHRRDRPMTPLVRSLRDFLLAESVALTACRLG
jgi:DNA-binding transcriptional LysR family regulator